MDHAQTQERMPRSRASNFLIKSLKSIRLRLVALRAPNPCRPYTQVFGPIRDLFARLPESRARGYKPGRFSFNVKGGRCEACQGDGLKRIRDEFPSHDVCVTCDVCRGPSLQSRDIASEVQGSLHCRLTGDACRRSAHRIGEYSRDPRKARNVSHASASAMCILGNPPRRYRVAKHSGSSSRKS